MIKVLLAKVPWLIRPTQGQPPGKQDSRGSGPGRVQGDKATRPEGTVDRTRIQLLKEAEGPRGPGTSPSVVVDTVSWPQEVPRRILLTPSLSQLRGRGASQSLGWEGRSKKEHGMKGTSEK